MQNPSALRDFWRKRPHDMVALAGGALVLGIVAALFFNIPQEYAKQWDIRWGYQWFIGLALLFCVGVVWNAKVIIELVRQNRPPLAYTILGVISTLLLVFFATRFIERQHRVLSDESSWQSMALQMRWNQSGGVCNQGVFQEDGKLDCRDEVNNFKGKSLSYIQSLFFRVFEPNRDTALHINLPLYALSLLLLFYALFLILKDPATALSAGILMGAMPIYLMQARSASTEVLYVLLLTLLMALFALMPTHRVNWPFQLLIIPILGFFSGTRQETIFCFLAFALYHHEFLRRRPWHTAAYAALVIAAAWPAINTMAAYRGFNFQAGEGVSAHSLDNLRYNLYTNLKIMLSPGTGPDGLMLNPFYSLHTWWIILGTIGVLYAAIRHRRYLWGLVLLALFHIQTFVVLINSSSTFEIDINQRYILIVLPTFALAMALGARDLVCDAWTALQRNSNIAANCKRASVLVLVVALITSGWWTWQHRESFAANILYRRNKLLLEEAFLNTELRKYPPNSIFIYARPWQMLCSGFNSFSERTFLSWSTQQFAEWVHFSNGHIYLVRGQDGHGTQSLAGRIVGFKTTDQVEQILRDWHVERLLFNSKDFGYPLTIDRILSKRGANRYGEQISLQLIPQQQQVGQAVSLVLAKRFAESVELRAMRGETPILSAQTVLENQDTMLISTEGLPAGIHYLDFIIQLPDGDSTRIQKDIILEDGSLQLLQSIPLASQFQGWGAPVMGRSVENNPLRIAGRTFTWGIGSHAPSTLSFELGGRFSQLVTHIGLDDESACGDGTRFKIRGDGRELYVSERLTAGDLDSLRLDIRGVRRLDLVQEELGDNFCDHGNWAGAYLLLPK